MIQFMVTFHSIIVILHTPRELIYIVVVESKEGQFGG